MKKHRFHTIYLTTTLSVALVLFLVGLQVIIGLSANELVKQIKENVVITAVLTDSADSDAVARLGKMLKASNYTKDYRYVSQAQALKEHIRYMGEDPEQFLGFNPLQASFEISVKAEYAHPDSIKQIATRLNTLPFVEKTIYQKDVIEALNKNLEQITYFMLPVAAVLLFIAIVLIVNTIRLNIYARRFLIKTMTLVGATAGFIRRPIVGKHMLIGFFAACIAIAMLAAIVYTLWQRYAIMIVHPTIENIAIIAGTVMISGLVICFLAAEFTASKYIRMKTDKLYN
ncbi:MAG: permease-like cell division protein FtsX [Paludibacteraceae bacterium]|nr:permease-like cell division protein FtsX [Paludibacteraceae bacterium]MBR1786157.1 permease-like cell division protein FtsX [Paludibacteraceae bacterium]